MTGFSFSKLRQRDWSLIVIALTLLAGVAWYYLLYANTLNEITDLEFRRDQLELDITRAQAAQRNLPALRAEVEQQELERQSFLAELPRASEVADLLGEVRLAAANSGVLLEQISQGSVSETIADVRPLSFELSSTGDYAHTMAFLSTLENLQRFTKIRQVGLSTTGDELADPLLNGSFSLTVYVYTGADPGDSGP